MDNENPTTIINTYPTVKEQVIGSAIALGFTAASTLAIFGGLALAGKLSDVRAARKAKKTQTN